MHNDRFGHALSRHCAGARRENRRGHRQSRFHSDPGSRRWRRSVRSGFGVVDPGAMASDNPGPAHRVRRERSEAEVGSSSDHVGHRRPPRSPRRTQVPGDAGIPGEVLRPCPDFGDIGSLPGRLPLRQGRWRCPPNHLDRHHPRRKPGSRILHTNDTRIRSFPRFRRRERGSPWRRRLDRRRRGVRWAWR